MNGHLLEKKKTRGIHRVQTCILLQVCAVKGVCWIRLGQTRGTCMRKMWDMITQKWSYVKPIIFTIGRKLNNITITAHFRLWEQVLASDTRSKHKLKRSQSMSSEKRITTQEKNVCATAILAGKKKIIHKQETAKTAALLAFVSIKSQAKCTESCNYTEWGSN